MSIPKRRICSYPILGAIVSPNKILLNWACKYRRDSGGRVSGHVYGCRGLTKTVGVQGSDKTKGDAMGLL